MSTVARIILRAAEPRLAAATAALAAALALAACTAGPDFRTPDAPSVDRYTVHGDRIATASQHTTVGATVDPTWWRAFGTPILDHLVDDALAHDQTLAQATASLDAARERAGAARGALWPQLSFAAVTGRQKYGVSLFGPSNFKIPPFSYYTAGPQVSYTLDFAGTTRRTIEARRAYAEFRGHEWQAVRLALVGQVVGEAIEISSAESQVAVVGRILDDDRRNLELVRRARDAGSAALPDVVSAQSQLAHDQTLLPALEQRRSSAGHALAALVGRAPAEAPGPDLVLDDWHLPADLPATLPSQLVRSRPDIRAAESQLHEASAAVGIATAQLYPQIVLSANTTQQALEPAHLFDAAANAWSFAGGLTAPLFEGGRLRAERRAAIDDYHAALADYHQTVLDAFRQVADVLRALQHDEAEVTAQRQALRTAVDSLRLARLAYREGASGILNVLDAERLAAQAELGLVQARTRQLQDTALLYLAQGGGTAVAAAGGRTPQH